MAVHKCNTLISYSSSTYWPLYILREGQCRERKGNPKHLVLPAPQLDSN